MEKKANMDTKPLIVEKTYNASVERVWSALTDLQKMRQWYFDIDDFKPEVGFEFHFNAQNKGRVFEHICVVKEVIPGKRLVHSWRYKDQPGDSIVTWELFAEDKDHTRLVLTHTGLETFPPLEDYARENFNKGWTTILGKMLKEYLG